MKRSRTSLLFILVSGLVVFGQWDGSRAKLTPEELAFRTRLETDPTMIKLTCGLLMPIGPKEMYAEEGTKQQTVNTRLRLAFYKAAMKKKTMRLTYECGTDEGTIVREYMLSEKGKLTAVKDFSRDYFGGNRFIVWECADLALGHYVTHANKEIVFEPLTLKNSAGKVIFLSCKSPDRTIIF